MRARKEFGSCHHVNEPVVVFEFNLDELQWLSSITPYGDSFSKDVQQAINWCEEQLHVKQNDQS